MVIVSKPEWERGERPIRGLEVSIIRAAGWPLGLREKRAGGRVERKVWMKVVVSRMEGEEEVVVVVVGVKRKVSIVGEGRGEIMEVKDSGRGTLGVISKGMRVSGLSTPKRDMASS